MSGHSKWASIKHSKGKADKQRSKVFSKLSKEISVAAKLGDKDPAMNPRLRSADLSLGFIAGSLSPSFAATLISLDNFENTLDLCLSAFPLECFILAHFE